MRAVQKTFAEEFDRVLVESDTSVRRLARLSGISRRTLENWLYGNTLRPRYVDQILQIARALKLRAVKTDRLLLSAGYPTLTRLKQKNQLSPDILLEWQLPPDTQKGQRSSALHHAQLLLQQMPWNEEAHREVMELLALNGRRSEALKQFKICEQALQDELGVEPSPETRALYERIKRTTHFSRDNIPAITTPLIGREEELAALSGLLANPNSRLVTITGLGGIGKTRLALEIAWQHTKGQFSDGVTFVQLAGLDSTELIVRAIAHALHLPLADNDKNPAQQLLDFLKAKESLLILDNCEHLLDGMYIVADIVKAAPEVMILATSRERLRLLAEYIFPLQGLAYDHANTSHPAAQLLVGTAQRINPHFEISEVNALSVNKICRMVEGLPLALELAASRLDTIAIDIIVAEVEKSLGYLAADLHDIPPRHRSLLALLESIWSHFDSQIQHVFAGLSIFRGSFSLEAALDIVDTTPQIVDYLVQHSILKYDGEQERYQLHEMLRQFADEKLSNTPQLEKAAKERHFRYYNELAKRGGEAMLGGDQSIWRTRIELEENNIRQAIDWAVQHNIDLAARLVVTLHIYWQISGQVLEAMQQYELILPFQEELSSEIRPWLFAVAAEMMHHLGRTQESLEMESKALPLFLEQEDEEGAIFIYLLWSIAARRISKDINTSIQLAEAGLQHFYKLGTASYYSSLLLESLSDSLTRSGRYEEAEARIRQGYQMCLQREDMMTATYFLAQMTMLKIIQGQPSEAYRHAEECLSASRQLNIVQAELIALDNLGRLDYEAGNLDQAEEFIADGIALARETNYRYYLAGMNIVMGEILMAKNAHQEALPFLHEALALFQEMEHQAGIPESIEHLAEWLWREDKNDPAPISWMACAIAHLTAHNQMQPPSEIARRARIREEMEARISQEGVAQAWTKGQRLSIEEALAEISLALRAIRSGSE